MGDLPPSYEDATGIPAVKPSAPPPGHITLTQNTNIIPMQSQQLSQPISSSLHSTSIPTPQTNVILRSRPNNKSGRKCLCTVIAIIFVIIIGLVVTFIIVKKSRPKYNTGFSNHFDGQPEYPTIDWEEFNRNNQILLDRFNRKINELPTLHFN